MNQTMRLFSGAYVGSRLLLAMIRRLLGIQDWSFLATIFGVGLVASALVRQIAPVFKASRPKLPSAGSVLLVGAVPSAAIQRTTGVKHKDARLVGSAVAMGFVLPTLSLMATSARAFSRSVVAFVRRYGL